MIFFPKKIIASVLVRVSNFFTFVFFYSHFFSFDFEWLIIPRFFIYVYLDVSRIFSLFRCLFYFHVLVIFTCYFNSNANRNKDKASFLDFFYGIPTRGRAPDSGPFPKGPQLNGLHLNVPRGPRNPRVQLYIISDKNNTKLHHQQDVTSCFRELVHQKIYIRG